MSILLAIQTVLSILLILCILLQSRAAGLTAGTSGVNQTVVQRRGAEKLLYQTTIGLSIAFFVLTVLQWYA
jgi:protein translocase SecG subunit